MVMTVAVLQHLNRHPKEASSLPKVSAVLHRQVAAVCRKRCGVTCWSRRAAFTAAAKPLRTERTGSPFHSTIAWVAIPSRCHRRR